MIDLTEGALQRFRQQPGGRWSMPGAEPSAHAAIWAEPVHRMTRAAARGRTELHSTIRSFCNSRAPLSSYGMTTRLVARGRSFARRSGTMIRRLFDTFVTRRI